MKAIVTMILLALNALHLSAKTSVPEFAEICGVRVGCDTMEMLERKIGRGLPQIGGHPRGGRAWQSRAGNCLILADGFHHYDEANGGRGRLLDWIEIVPRSRDPEIPMTRLSRDATLFLGVVSLGMTKDKVLRAIKKKLPAPKVEGQRLVWTAKGFVRVSDLNNVTTHTWRAELSFDQGKLAAIRIEGQGTYGR